jgi:uncharacterized surface protein with fasciclin (FAS1) repeats
VVKANLLSTLTASSSNLTLFAPDNELSKQPELQSVRIVSNNLAPILTYHVIDEKYLAMVCLNSTSVSTLGGIFT